MEMYEDYINVITKWLKAKNIGMWATFDLSDDSECVDAAQWLWSVLSDLSAFMEDERTGTSM